MWNFLFNTFFYFSCFWTIYKLTFWFFSHSSLIILFFINNFLITFLSLFFLSAHLTIFRPLLFPTLQSPPSSTSFLSIFPSWYGNRTIHIYRKNYPVPIRCEKIYIGLSNMEPFSGFMKIEKRGRKNTEITEQMYGTLYAGLRYVQIEL